ncbi:MAG TPA: ABC transporter substrate-binding protein [Acidobacteriaceae bacterium]|nr:ABC transporter substrate-binding protein [Acidobacteriaceae bacterium]
MAKSTQGCMATLLTGMAMLVVLLAPVATRQAAAQNKMSAVPYDSIASDGENYAGPARASKWDETGATVYIGLMAPLHGPDSAEGEALVAAANMALQDSTQRPLPGERHVELAIGDESGPAWGHVSDVILQLVLRENVLALITSTDGTDTHVSEQVGNRIGVPILTLSSDATTTQIDIPWIFRLGPSDAVQARTIAMNIYRERDLKKVMVIFDGDHDGRGGATAIRQAAILLGAVIPDELALDPLQPDFSSVVRRIQKNAPQAIVLWTRADVAQHFLPMLHAAGISATIYLSQQAAQAGSGSTLTQSTMTAASIAAASGAWTIASRGQSTRAQKSFAARYRQKTGRPPSEAAAEAYDAVCLTVRALREAGPNRARMRDQLAQTRGYSGASGTISFDREGNNTTQSYLVALRPRPLSAEEGDSAE